MDGDRFRRIERRTRHYLKPAEGQFLLRAIKQYRDQHSIRGLLVAIGRVIVKPKTFVILDEIRSIILDRHLNTFDREAFIWKQTEVPPGASSFSGDYQFFKANASSEIQSASKPTSTGLVVVTIKNRKGYTLGLSVRANGKSVKVSTVIPGSEAFKAGVRVGDTVVAINRTRTFGLDYATSRNLLEDAASSGRKVKVILEPLQQARSPVTIRKRPSPVTNNPTSRASKSTSRASTRSGMTSSTLSLSSDYQKRHSALSEIPEHSEWLAPRPHVHSENRVHSNNAFLNRPEKASVHASNQVQISFRNPGNVGLGLYMSGGKFVGDPMIVDAVAPGSVAHVAGVQPGMEIIGSNGVDFRGLTRDEASRVLAASAVISLCVKPSSHMNAFDSQSLQVSHLNRYSPRSQQLHDQPRTVLPFVNSNQPIIPLQNDTRTRHQEERRLLPVDRDMEYHHACLIPTERPQADRITTSDQIEDFSRDICRENPVQDFQSKRTKLTMATIRSMLNAKELPPPQTNTGNARHPVSSHRISKVQTSQARKKIRAAPTRATVRRPKREWFPSTVEPGSPLHVEQSDKLDSPSTHHFFLKAKAGSPKPSTNLSGFDSPGDAFLNNGDDMDTSLYGFDESFSTSPKSVLPREAQKAPARPKLMLGIPQSSSTTDSYNSYDRFVRQNSPKKEKRQHNLKRVPLCAPPVPNPPAPAPPAPPVPSMRAEGKVARAPLSAITNAALRDGTNLRNSSKGLNDEISSFRRDTLSRVSPCQSRSSSRNTDPGGALLDALKLRLKASRGHLMPPTPGLDNSWLSQA